MAGPSQGALGSTNTSQTCCPFQGVSYNPAAKWSWLEEALPGLAFLCPASFPFWQSLPQAPRVLLIEACAVSSRTHTGSWTQVLRDPRVRGALCPVLLATLLPGHQLGAARFGDRAAGIWPPPAQCPRGPTLAHGHSSDGVRGKCLHCPVPAGHSLPRPFWKD